MAIEHAEAGLDGDRVVPGLVGQLTQPAFASGRIDTVLRWMEWFDDHGLIEDYPAVAAYGASIDADLGRALDAERWASAADPASADDVIADGSTMRGMLAFLRLRVGGESTEQMRRDAELGLRELSPASRLRPAMLVALGTASVLDGDYDTASPILAHAVEAALHVGGLPAASLAVAEQALIAIERTDWTEAAALTVRACSRTSRTTASRTIR